MTKESIPEFLEEILYPEMFKHIITCLERGEKFEKIYKWLKKEIYTKGGKGISADIDKMEEKHFGSTPKSIRERINTMIENLNSIGIAGVDIKELTNLLIELRKEENA